MDLNHMWVLLPDIQIEFRGDHDEQVESFAHEIGHALGLSHGNGVDDDMNGTAAGLDGPKRFDKFCDPAGTDNSSLMPVEDQPTGVQCGLTLMHISLNGCTNLTDLQTEMARGVAARFKNCGGQSCFEPPASALVKP